MNFLSKQTQISFLSLFMLTGCHDKSTDTAQSATKPHIATDSVTSLHSTVTPVTSAASSIAQRMRPLLGGAWLNTTYAAYLQKTHSPRQADGHWGPSGITEVLIDPQSYKNDSMSVALGASNHEGLPLRYVHLRARKADGSWPTTADEAGSEANLFETSLRYQIRNTDTLLYLDQRNRKTNRVTVTTFRKLHGFSATGDSLPGPVGYFVNGLSFAGTHTVTDSTGHTASVHFTEYGRLQGWLGYKTYSVNTDFVGPFHELDTIFFDINQKNQRELAFTITGDTTKLYAVHDDTTTYKRRRGRLCYTLVRRSK